MICPKCNEIHEGNFGSGIFCSRSCANSRKISGVKLVKCNKCKKELRVDIRTPNSQILCYECRSPKEKIKKRCKKCGELSCPRPDLCKKSIKILVRYFGFDTSCLGSLKYLEEFSRVIKLLEEEYLETSLGFLEKKYGYPNSYLQKLFVTLGLKRRTQLEGSKKKILEEGVSKTTKNINYKQGWHETWEGKRVFLRSSYEFRFAEELDKKKVSYEVEYLRLIYWDTQLHKERLAIPDFFLPKENKVVEIKAEKSIYYDELNMKDKEKAYRAHGYDFELVFLD